MTALLLTVLAPLRLPAAAIDKGRLEIDLGTVYMGSDGTEMRVPNNLRQPLGEDSDRLFVVSTLGQINVIQDGTASTFLDLSEEAIFGTETGLLGMAFHPGFSDPLSPGFHKLYTLHSVEVDPAATVRFSIPGKTVTHHNVLTEWQVDPNNPNLVDLSTRREIYREAHPSVAIHNAGAIDFGPDGYLYISTGTPPGVQSNTQLYDNIHGKVLRIDPMAPEETPASLDPVSDNGQYRIPASNPFVTDPEALGEIFAYGFRNPFRMSVDSETGIVFAGDVGQGQREEVDAVLPGQNYGWPYWEGTLPGLTALPDPAPETVMPLAEYSNFAQGGDGRAVIGGFVYRGSIEALQGKYVFGDLTFGSGPYGTNPGRLFWIDPYDEFGDLKDPNDIEISEFRLSEETCDMVAGTPPVGGGCQFDLTLYGFGVDANGELYVLGEEANIARVYKITNAEFVIPGDFDRNQIVNGDDLTRWAGDFGLNGSSDADNDGDSDGVDFLAWQRSFTHLTSVAVPEPTCWMLWAGFLIVFGSRLRR